MELNYIKKLDERPLYNDSKGFVEKWDFSRANTNAEARIEAITKVASVCYNSKKIQGSLKVFNMLEAESLGLPSTSFEYVPVLIPYELYCEIRYEVHKQNDKFILNIEKFGELVKDETNIDNTKEDEWYLLTNFRACLYDANKYELPVDFKSFFNASEKEIDIISMNYKCFFTKTPIFATRQLVRHRVQYLQELSRRYTNNKTAPMDFYIKSYSDKYDVSDEAISILKEVFEYELEKYDYLVDNKLLLPEDARSILGTGLYTQLWSGWLNNGYENLVDLRTKDKTQQEFRELVIAMENMK